jgi:hypothetical protein
LKTKAWVFRFMRAGVSRKMGLGPVSTQPGDARISLAQARQKAGEARGLLIDGIDPDRGAEVSARPGGVGSCQDDVVP